MMEEALNTKFLDISKLRMPPGLGYDHTTSLAMGVALILSVDQWL